MSTMDTFIAIDILLGIIAAGTLTIRRLNHRQADRAAAMHAEPFRPGGKGHPAPRRPGDRSKEAPDEYEPAPGHLP